MGVSLLSVTLDHHQKRSYSSVSYRFDADAVHYVVRPAAESVNTLVEIVSHLMELLEFDTNLTLPPALYFDTLERSMLPNAACRGQYK